MITSMDRQWVGGAIEVAAVVPGKPDQSHLLQQVMLENGEAAMPKGERQVEIQITVIVQVAPKAIPIVRLCHGRY